jgi:pimeloyl-ACP methyl ester carboxylesterase
MEHVTGANGTEISYITYGSGPPLVLVHGGFSDHETNWQEARSFLAERFTIHAIARRGRGESSATTGHTVDDEAADVAAVVRHLGRPVFLLGHSYGAVCALKAAALYPAGVSKLVLYEPPPPTLLDSGRLAKLEGYAERKDWDGMVEAFMREVVQVPQKEVDEIRATPFWGVWTVDAAATLGDLRGYHGHQFEPARYQSLSMPVLLLVGTESPREIYLTDPLAAVLPDVRIRELAGQAHEGMTTAPLQFVDIISEFLLARSSLT